MNVKIALYMSGSYARILRHVPDFLPQFFFIACCANIKAYETCEACQSFDRVNYLYDDFNIRFREISEEEVLKSLNDINLTEVLLVDKSHFKRKAGAYQVRAILTMASIFQEWFHQQKPDFIFFPIIESVDAMLAYRIAKQEGIKPICYAHARHLKYSFFSDSHTETLPSYFCELPDTIGLKERAESIIDTFRAQPVTLDYKTQYSDSNEDILPDEPPPNVFFRFLRNILIRLTKERHNQTLRLWIKLQVFIEKLLVPLQRCIYLFVESVYIRPHKSLPKMYDYFPLHFAPESSINTPAPYYIDQKRVVDKILLERSGNCSLVLKEHPAMLCKRSLSFYRNLKRMPFVTFVPLFTSSIGLTKSARTVYSVTGTACLEAFMLGVPWVQFGENFLSDWVKRVESLGRRADPVNFVMDVLKVSGDFLLFSPSRSREKNMCLFSTENVVNFSNHLAWHIDKTRMYSSNASMDMMQTDSQRGGEFA